MSVNASTTWYHYFERQPKEKRKQRHAQHKTDLQMLVLNAGLISLQPLNCNPFFTRIQEFRSDWGVWHEDCDHNTPNAA